jgi:hypothetical protein
MVSDSMKIGDLVKWDAGNGDGDDGTVGIIVQFSRTGHNTKSAKVVWSDGYDSWHDTKKLELINARD